jgi:hypothetical protein
MRYKLLIIKGIMFVIIIAAMDNIGGYICKLLEKKAYSCNPKGMIAEYTMWGVKSDIIIIGASDAMHSYIPSMIRDYYGMSTYNCGYDGHTFYYQACAIYGILKRNHPKYIIWSFYPYFLQLGEQSGELSQLRQFYESNELCKNVIDASGLSERIKMFSKLYRYNSLLFGIAKNMFLHPSSDDGYIPLANGGYEYPKIYKRIYNDINVDEKKVETIIRIINICMKSEVRLIIVFAPRLEVSNYLQIRPFKELKKITNKYKVPLIDEFVQSEELMGDPSLFKDSSHVNGRGAERFTQLLCKRIEECCYVEQ